MKTKVSYQKDWSADGTCYRQTIRVKMTDADLSALNDNLSDIADGLRQGGDIYNGRFISFPNYLKEELVFGKNYLKVSQFYALSSIYDWNLEKRILDGRNTIFIIERKKA